jgi:hypothetical protein
MRRAAKEAKMRRNIVTALQYIHDLDWRASAQKSIFAPRGVGLLELDEAGGPG